MKQRLAILKIHSSLKGAGVSDDLTGFNIYSISVLEVVNLFKKGQRNPSLKL